MPEPGAPVNWPGRLSWEARFDSVPWYSPRPVTELCVRPYTVSASFCTLNGIDLAYSSFVIQGMVPRLCNRCTSLDLALPAPPDQILLLLARDALRPDMPEPGASVNWPGRLGWEARFDSQPQFYSRPVTELIVRPHR